MTIIDSFRKQEDANSVKRINIIELRVKEDWDLETKIGLYKELKKLVPNLLDKSNSESGYKILNEVETYMHEQLTNRVLDIYDRLDNKVDIFTAAYNSAKRIK